MRYLIIAGHGKRADGSYDPGASGFIPQGEHKYVSQKIFKAMKKYATKDFIFLDSYNVYSRGNIVSLARAYGLDTVVVEIHFDASGSEKASGGHVIIYSQFEPDSVDLRIRDVIKEMVGLRSNYTHSGHEGISGRHDLANVRRAASGDSRGSVNYRLIELGFGTNRKDADIMLNQSEEYGKRLVSAITGEKAIKPATPTLKPKPKKSSEQVAQEIAKGLGGWGNNPQRAVSLTKAGYNADAIQRRVNDILGAVAKPYTPPKKSQEEVAREIADGKGGWGNNPDRARKLRAQGYDADAVQRRVNVILGGGNKGLSSSQINSIARQVLKGIDDKGNKIPYGRPARAKHFGISSADMDKVQARVNRTI